MATRWNLPEFPDDVSADELHKGVLARSCVTLALVAAI